MAEGVPISPPGGEARQGASSPPVEQPEQRSADETQLLDAQALAAELEKVGFHSLAETMRQPTASHEEIAQRQHQEKEARFAEMDAEVPVRPPSIGADKAQRLDLHEVADLAEQQKKHTLAAELRNIANKPPTT